MFYEMLYSLAEALQVLNTGCKINDALIPSPTRYA